MKNISTIIAITALVIASTGVIYAQETETIQQKVEAIANGDVFGQAVIGV